MELHNFTPSNWISKGCIRCPFPESHFIHTANIITDRTIEKFTKEQWNDQGKPKSQVPYKKENYERL